MDKKTKAKKTIPDTICRVHRSGGYAVLSNCFVRSTNIGCDSIGLLGKINDLPPTWNFTIAGLVAICEDGETAIKSQLAELEQWGYVKKTLLMPNESPTGRISYLYDFYEYSELDDSIPKYDIEMETFTADNATLNRVKKDSNFTIISAKLLRTNKIRNKLIGFMLKVLSLPNSWNFSMSGLKAICKEGKTAVHNAVNKLIDKGYLVRTKLLSNESVNNHFEYVYSFFDVPVSKEEADELEAETRRKAITIREGGKAKAVVSSSAEKQKVENPYLDTPPTESPLSENQGQYNNNNTKQKNQLLCDKSSIIPAVAKPTFNIPSVEKSAERVTDGIVGFIVDEICSPLPYTTLRGQAFPRAVIQSKMLKANIYMVENVLENMAKVDNIKDFRRYFISSLYNEVLTYHFNEGCESRNIDEQIRRDLGYGMAV